MSEKIVSIIYSDRTRERAERALRCSPFLLSLFLTMRDESVTLKTITDAEEIPRGYSRFSLTELTRENYLLWLIQVGVLRREVDGQGITDSFRLTPLGRQLIESYQSLDNTIPSPSPCDRIQNIIAQWFRIF